LELNAHALPESVDDTEEKKSMQKRYHELLQLEQRKQEMLEIKTRQQVVKRYFEKSTNSNDFQNNQLVLLWNKEK
jgi:hypothetical protein